MVAVAWSRTSPHQPVNIVHPPHPKLFLAEPTRTHTVLVQIKPTPNTCMESPHSQAYEAGPTLLYLDIVKMDFFNRKKVKCTND
jgi:hypothetical protein